MQKIIVRHFLTNHVTFPCEMTVTISASIKGNFLMQRYERLVHELYRKPKSEIIMGSFTEIINVDFAMQPKKRKRKKALEKLFQNSNGAKTFDLSSKNYIVKKIHLCN